VLVPSTIACVNFDPVMLRSQLR